MPPSNLRPAVEALLFSSDQPLSLALLSEALESAEPDVHETLRTLADEYAAREAGVVLREIAGGWIFVTTPEQGEWVARMLRGKRRMRLSRAALETMAIVAYKQPVTKSEIESIRGVDSSGVMATLLERNLLTIKGRSKVVGRPLLYGTTTEFLSYFGLNDLSELPRPEELRALVAAREPEQLEMLELDPSTGLPLAGLEYDSAARERATAAGLDASAAAVAGDWSPEADIADAEASPSGPNDEDDEDEFGDDDADEDEGDDDDLDGEDDEDEDDEDDEESEGDEPGRRSPATLKGRETPR